MSPYRIIFQTLFEDIEVRGYVVVLQNDRRERFRHICCTELELKLRPVDYSEYKFESRNISSASWKWEIDMRTLQCALKRQNSSL